MSFPGKPATPKQISGNQRDGWRLFMRQSNVKSIVKWGLDGEITMLPVTWAASFSSGIQARARDRLVVGSKDGLGPIKFGEFDWNTGALLYETLSGGAQSFYPEAVEVGNGIAGVIFSNSTADKIVFDSFYRAPFGDGPMLPGTGSSPSWYSEHYEFSSENKGFGQAYFIGGTEGPDGHIWFFFGSDSAKVIGLIRFRIEGERMVLVDFIRQFIKDAQDGLSPSGENFFITAVHDRRNKRILLAYQCWPHWPGCGQHTITSKWAITEVKPDKSAMLLAMTPWVAQHSSPYSLPAIFARPDGIYYDLEILETTECKLGWNIGKIDNGQFNTMSNLPGGKLLSFSPDGWILAMDATVVPAVSDLIRIQFPAVLTINKVAGNVAVDWSPAELTDVLEERADYGPWVAVSTGAPPVVMPIKNGLRIYRVKRLV